MNAGKITLTGFQLLDALAFVAPDGGDREQLESELTFEWLEARTSDEGEAMGAGIYCWLSEYPEEGVYGPLGERSVKGRTSRCVLQDWVLGLPMMQQTVLLTAVRGPDGHPKYGDVKLLLRWYRRCLLLSALDGAVLGTPYVEGGGSFTGPSLDGGAMWDGLEKPVESPVWYPPMDDLVSAYLRKVDALPHHFQMHFMHAVEIMGFKHPDPEVRSWWNMTYQRLVGDMHLWPETEEQMDRRLGDSRDGWLERADPATAE